MSSSFDDEGISCWSWPQTTVPVQKKKCSFVGQDDFIKAKVHLENGQL